MVAYVIYNQLEVTDQEAIDRYRATVRPWRKGVILNFRTLRPAHSAPKPMFATLPEGLRP